MSAKDSFVTLVKLRERAEAAERLCETLAAEVRAWRDQNAVEGRETATSEELYEAWLKVQRTRVDTDEAWAEDGPWEVRR